METFDDAWRISVANCKYCGFKADIKKNNIFYCTNCYNKIVKQKGESDGIRRISKKTIYRKI